MKKKYYFIGHNKKYYKKITHNSVNGNALSFCEKNINIRKKITYLSEKYLLQIHLFAKFYTNSSAFNNSFQKNNIKTP